MNTVTQMQTTIEIYGELRKKYTEAYAQLANVRETLRAGNLSLNDTVNFMYILRETSKLIDDLRKEYDGIIKMLENACCLMYVEKHQNSPENAGPIRASLATGTPTVKVGVKLPNMHREPDKFNRLMRSLGVERSAIDAKLVKPHWPGLCEHVSLLIAEGKSLPHGFNPNDTYPTYSVIIRSKKNLDEVVRQVKEEEVAWDKILE